jgi:transposase
MIKRLAERYGRLHVGFEAGPRGYGLYRQIQALGHDWLVVAPARISKRSGERVKTNRRDAVTLARLHRAGELTGVVGARRGS